MTRRPDLAAVAAEHADWLDTQQVVINLGDLRGLLAIHNGVLAELALALAGLEAIATYQHTSHITATEHAGDSQCAACGPASYALAVLDRIRGTQAAATRHTTGGDAREWR